MLIAFWSPTIAHVLKNFEYRGTPNQVQGGAWWPSGLERWLGLATGWSWPGSNPAASTSLRNFGNSVYPAFPASFGGDTKGHTTRNEIFDDGF